ncbi:hypothetical protein AB6D11_03090 [Vibrio splendidus]
MYKKFFHTALLLAISSPTWSASTRTEVNIPITPETPLIGQAQLFHFDMDDTAWLMLKKDDKHQFNRFKNNTVGDNTRPEENLVHVNLYGLDTTIYRSSDNDATYNLYETAQIVKSHFYLNKSVSYYCFTLTTGGKAECAIFTDVPNPDGVNIDKLKMLNEMIIQEGLSRFEVNMFADANINKVLNAAQNLAKTEEKGTWMPLIDMFKLD